jgi:hypothetical protein
VRRVAVPQMKSTTTQVCCDLFVNLSSCKNRQLILLFLGQWSLVAIASPGAILACPSARLGYSSVSLDAMSATTHYSHSHRRATEPATRVQALTHTDYILPSCKADYNNISTLGGEVGNGWSCGRHGSY